MALYKLMDVQNTADGKLLIIGKSLDGGVTTEQFGVPVTIPDTLTLFSYEMIVRYKAGETLATLKTIIRNISDGQV